MSILSFFWRSRLDRPGVYRIRNNRNGMVYIGSTKRTIRVRLDEHMWRLNSGTHPNSMLQADWDTYGQRAFVLKVLENTEADQVESRELYWQLRAPAGTLYARLARPIEVIQAHQEWCREDFALLTDALILVGWSDDDFRRIFRKQTAVRMIARRDTIDLSDATPLQRLRR